MESGSWVAELLLRLADELHIDRKKLLGKAFEIVQEMERGVPKNAND